MAAKIDIIAPGYANPIAGSSNIRARGSCCLVRSSAKKNILFDTLGPWDASFLVKRLASFNIHPDDVHYVVCSHSHPDHIGNLNLFASCQQIIRHFVGTSSYNQDLYFDQSTVFPQAGTFKYKLNNTNGNDCVDQEAIHYQDCKLETNVTLKHNPGHTMECISLLIDNCQTYGRVALAGDLFECQADIDDAYIWLSAGSQNDILQQLYRTAVYKSVDYILPGHGDIFKTEAGKRLACKLPTERTVISSTNWPS